MTSTGLFAIFFLQNTRDANHHEKCKLCSGMGVNFNPESPVNFAPESGVNFGPEWV